MFSPERHLNSILDPSLMANESSRSKDSLRLLVFPKELQQDYTEQKTLGQGSFGITYLATRKSDQQTVAVKFLMCLDWT